jgi:hypothetical protein
MIHVSVKDQINASADTVGAISNVEQYIPMITSSNFSKSLVFDQQIFSMRL